MNRQSSIGVFDSGLGGLTVAREIMRQMPDENIVYFGDTARVPYGSKSQGTIIRYSEQIVNFLMTRNVKAIVVACNTASALALDAVRDKVDIPMLGVVVPGAVTAVQATKNNRIGVIGTESLVNSGVYIRTIHELSRDAQVFQKACPLLCPLVEEGWWHDELTTEVVRRYLSELKQYDIDTLIMGCTHYPLLRSTFREVLGDSVELINPAYETSMELASILKRKRLTRFPENDGRRHEFYVSDDPERFVNFATSVLKFDIGNAEKIPIENYEKLESN